MYTVNLKGIPQLVSRPVLQEPIIINAKLIPDRKCVSKLSSPPVAA